MKPPSRYPAGPLTLTLIAIIVLAVLAEGIASLLLLAAVLAAALTLRGRSFRLGRQWQLWLSVLGLALISALTVGERDTVLLGIALSSEGLGQGIVMGLRALTIAVAVAVYADLVSVDALARLFERAGLRGLGFALGVAFNMLPTLRVELRHALDTMRLRGGFRRRPLARLKLLSVAILSNVLRHADQIVSAAEARAFDPGLSGEVGRD